MDGQIEAGSWAWYQVPNKNILRGGKIASIAGQDVTIYTENDTTETVPIKNVKPMHPSSHQPVDDMTNLTDLHEGSILRNLMLRFQEDKIYTFTGSILVALNPFKNINLYGSEVVQRYQGVRLGELPPHIFAIADETHFSMKSKKVNQCVVISGESGAGKTESTKLILSYLAHLSGKHSQVEEQLIDSSPILEAFGNAKTTRNNNSSRFGKFMEIQFNDQGSIEGAKINQYLLEKSRIVQQAPEERNYHIFYNLLAGATPEEKASFKLTKPDDYNYTNKSGCFKARGIDDELEYDRVKSAMENLGLPESEVNDIMKVVAIVLHIGNIAFQKKDEETTLIENAKQLDICASLLGLPSQKLGFALTNQMNITRGEKIVRPLSITASCDAREALAKALYGWMFTYIVTRINACICKNATQLFIGVLDIFGFEDFKINSFEQFCINYANERLQQFFNQHIFKLEQEIYTNEAISWAHIDFVDNQPCLDLISKKPIGILHILDEECNFPKASDNTFLEKLHKNHVTKDQKYYEKPKLSKTTFIVIHYAGKVSYEVQNFLEKNRDRLREDMQTLLEESTFSFIKKIMADSIQDKSSDPKGKSSKVTTVGSQFHDSLTSLVATLSSCNPYFVRCVKPNPQQVAAAFDDDLVEAQLRYSGLLETVRIRKAGYPVRLTFADFIGRYMIIDLKKKRGDEPKQAIEGIMRSLQGVQAAHWQIGKTKVFMKEQAELQLEKARFSVLSQYVVRIQRLARVFIGRKRRQRMLTMIKVAQRYIRGWVARNRFQKLRKAAVKVQTFVRMVVARQKFIRFKASVLEVQKVVRILLGMEMIRERDELLIKEARAKAAAIKAAELRARLEKEKGERLEKERVEKERQEQERLEKERQATAAPPSAPALTPAPAAPPSAPPVSPAPPSPAAPAPPPAGSQSPVARKISSQGVALIHLNRSNQVGRKASVDQTGLVDEIDRHIRAMMEDTSEGSKEINFDDWFGLSDLQDDINKELQDLEKEVEDTEAYLAENKREIEAREEEMVHFEGEDVLPRSASLESVGSDGGFSDYSFIKYGKYHFPKHIDPYFSQTPLKQSLLELPEQTRHEALVISQMILSFMGDHNLRQILSEQDVVRLIIEKGIHLPSLRDEIFCQIMKQTCQNPRRESEERGYWLLYLCLSCFTGSPDFNNWIRTHITNFAPVLLKNHALTAMDYTLKKGSRKMPLGIYEFTKKMEGEFAFQYPIKTELEAKSATIKLESSTKVSEIITAACAQLRLNDKGFGISFSFMDQHFVLDPSDFIFDVFSQAESDEFVTSLDPEQLPVIKLVKAFLEPEELVTDPTLIELLYNQVVTLAMKEGHPIPVEEAAAFAATQALLKWGDKASGSIAEHLSDLLTPKLLRQHDTSFWEGKIGEYLNSFTSFGGPKTPEVLKKKIIEIARFCPGFFGKRFSATCLGKSKERVFGKKKDDNRDAILVIDSVGIHFLHPSSREMALSLPYFEIETYEVTRDTLNIQLEGVLNLFKISKASEIKDLLSVIISQLHKTSNHVLATVNNSTDGRDLLKFSKDELITVTDRNPKEKVWRGRIGNRVGWFSPDLVEPVVLKPKHLHEEEKKKKAAAALAAAKHQQQEEKKIQAQAQKAETDNQQYSMMNFAKLYFTEYSPNPSATAKLTLKRKLSWGKKRGRTDSNVAEWGWSDLVRKIKHSSAPIQAPLTKIYVNEDQEFCIEMFKAIMKIMGDLPSKQSPLELSKLIVQRCLAHNGIRDEAYCQIVKQITGHPARGQPNCRRGWELLSLFTGFFPPSTLFEPYLRKYIHQYSSNPDTEFNSIALRCEAKLRSLKKLGPRQHPPNADELNTVLGMPLFVKVLFPDTSVKAFEVNSGTTGRDLLTSICSRLNLENPDEYAVIMDQNGKENMCGSNNYLMDMICEAEGDSDSNLGGSKTTLRSIQYKLHFRKIIWPKTREVNLENEQLVNVLFFQTLEKLTKGGFRCSFDDVLHLAASRIRLFENTERTESEKEETYVKYILSTHLKTIPMKEWILQIDEILEGLRKKSVHDTKVAFVKRAMAWSSFSDSLFPLQKPKYEKMELPSEVILAVNSEGIKLLDVEKMTVLVAQPYQEITSWRYGPEQISLKIGGMVQRAQINFRGQTTKGQEICHIISIYVAAHNAATENQKRLLSL